MGRLCRMWHSCLCIRVAEEGSAWRRHSSAYGGISIPAKGQRTSRRATNSGRHIWMEPRSYRAAILRKRLRTSRDSRKRMLRLSGSGIRRSKACSGVSNSQDHVRQKLDNFKHPVRIVRAASRIARKPEFRGRGVQPEREPCPEMEPWCGDDGGPVCGTSRRAGRPRAKACAIRFGASKSARSDPGPAPGSTRLMLGMSCHS